MKHISYMELDEMMPLTKLTFSKPRASTTGVNASVMCCDVFGLMMSARTGVSDGVAITAGSCIEKCFNNSLRRSVSEDCNCA